MRQWLRSGTWPLACALAVAAAAFVLTSRVDSAEDWGKYVGAMKCKSCHFEQFQTWRKRKMAKAFDRIKDEKDKNLCYGCHTTGYGKPGGFVDAKTTPKMVSVQCEDCHGPGEKHVEVSQKAEQEKMSEDPATVKIIKGTTYKTPPGATCAKCHSPHIPDKAKAVREGKIKPVLHEE